MSAVSGITYFCSEMFSVLAVGFIGDVHGDIEALQWALDALADAERERARAELALALFQTQATIGRARRERAVAIEKLQRDRVLVESANRIAAMSLVAYREGAQGLPAVLEAQRNARDILSQYVNDLADAWIATATLRLYSLAAPQR